MRAREQQTLQHVTYRIIGELAAFPSKHNLSRVIMFSLSWKHLDAGNACWRPLHDFRYSINIRQDHKDHRLSRHLLNLPCLLAPVLAFTLALCWLRYPIFFDFAFYELQRPGGRTDNICSRGGILSAFASVLARGPEGLVPSLF